MNAVNSGLRGGGGVDGAIHRAAGDVIDRECRAYVAQHGSLPPGKAMWTTSGNLAARYVIHTVGPIYRSDAESEPVLASAYCESLRLADKLALTSISFPAISAGIYGYPLDKAARVALNAIINYLQMKATSLELVQVVCFTDTSYEIFHHALAGALIPGEKRDAKERITVIVRLFAAPREFAGKRKIDVRLPSEVTLSDLVDRLGADYPGLGRYLPYSKLAVNHTISTPQATLNDGDEMAVLPPVGGG